MKKVLLFVFIVLTSFTLFACDKLEAMPVEGDTFQMILDRGYIVVGLECNYAPFNWSVEKSAASELAVIQNGSKTYCDGYDIQIARSIADALAIDLVVVAIEWDGLIPSLATNGQIDMIIAGMSPTAERAETVSFSNEYYHSTHVVVLRADSPYASATSLNDFSDADVVGQMNTFYDELIDQLPLANHVNPLGDVPTIVTGIKSGIYDATILELPVAVAITAANPELTYIEFASGSGFNVAYEDSAVAIAVRQGDVSLLIQINLILATISNPTRESWMLSAINRQPE